jgi:hypothetical protein
VKMASASSLTSSSTNSWIDLAERSGARRTRTSRPVRRDFGDGNAARAQGVCGLAQSAAAFSGT